MNDKIENQFDWNGFKKKFHASFGDDNFYSKSEEDFYDFYPTNSDPDVYELDQMVFRFNVRQRKKSLQWEVIATWSERLGKFHEIYQGYWMNHGTTEDGMAGIKEQCAIFEEQSKLLRKLCDFIDDYRQ